MALFLVALVFLGFAPSFYLRGIVPEFPRPNPSLPPSVLMHGLLFSLWMLVFIAQVRLVSAGRRDLHMKLGAASMVLAIALVPVMYLTAVWQVARANQPPFTTPLDWTILPLAVIPPFIYLIYQGWKRRREAQWRYTWRCLRGDLRRSARRTRVPYVVGSEARRTHRACAHVDSGDEGR